MSVSSKRGLSLPDFTTRFRMFHIPPTATTGDSRYTNHTKWSTYEGIDFKQRHTAQPRTTQCCRVTRMTYLIRYHRAIIWSYKHSRHW